MFNEPIGDDALFEKSHKEISSVLQNSILEIVQDDEHMKIFKFIRPDGTVHPFVPIRISIMNNVVTLNYYGNVLSFYNEGIYGSNLIEKFDEHDLSKIILSLPTNVKMKEYCSDIVLKKLDELIIEFLEYEEEGSSENEELFSKIKENILDQISLDSEHSFIHTISECYFDERSDDGFEYYNLISELEDSPYQYTHDFKKYAQIIHVTSNIYKDFKNTEKEIFENENT